MRFLNVLLKLKKELLVLAILCVCISCVNKKEYDFKFQNPSLSTKERVADLVSQMTLKEKVSQMRYDAPGIGTNVYTELQEQERQLCFLKQLEWELHLTLI